MPICLDHSGRPPDSLVATLHYLELGCSDPRASGDFYRRALGYALSKEGEAIIARGPDRQLALVTGVPRSLVSAGFMLPDRAELDRLRDRIGRAGWPARDGSTRFFGDAVIVHDPDGNCLAFGLANGEPLAEAGATLDARLQHVVVASRAPARIVAFFRDVLGFTLSDDVLADDGSVRTSFLRCSQEHHSFAVFLASEDRLDHHCYETRDWNGIRDWADRLADERIPLQWGPGRHGPGNNLFIFVHDPDGNWVEISAELELVEHARPVGRWPHEERTLNSWGLGLLRS